MVFLSVQQKNGQQAIAQHGKDPVQTMTTVKSRADGHGFLNSEVNRKKEGQIEKKPIVMSQIL